MTEERFEELINLYLDNEIGRRDLGDLKGAIKDNLVRRRKFEHACQVHQAARKALSDRAENEKKPSLSPPRPTGKLPASESIEARKARLVQAPLGTAAGVERLVRRQELAQRNASVSTLAERQVAKGAASTVDLKSMGSSSSRRASSKENSADDSPNGSTGTIPNEGALITFFDSAAGMLVSGFLILILGFVLFLAFETTNTTSDDDNSDPKNASGVQVIPHHDASAEFSAAQERLAAEARGRPIPADGALGPQAFQAALNGSSALGTVPVDFSAPSADSPSSNGTTSDASAALSTQSSPSMLLAPTTVTIGSANSTALNITIPDLSNQSTPSLLPDVPTVTPTPVDNASPADSSPGTTVIIP